MAERGRIVDVMAVDQEEKLEVEAARAKTQKARAHEFGARALNHLPQYLRYAFQLFEGRLIHECDGHRVAAYLDVAVIGDLLLQQVGVGDDLGLAIDGPQAGAFKADMLDGGGRGVILNCVALPEGAVEDDRKRGKKIGEYALCREADRDAPEDR